MITLEPLPFINEYLNALNSSLKEENPNYELTFTQRIWIGFCLMGILMTNTVCWAKFERLSLKAYTQQAISWMFRHSKISWDWLLISSTRALLKKYNIESGVLVIDDKDLGRSKNAKHLSRLHKIKDKKTGGYVLGQNMVFLYLVTNKISFPVGCKFYSPDPSLKEWEKNDAELKKRGVSKKDRPKKPERSCEHPKKYELAITLLKQFKEQFSNFKVKAVLADCLYGTSFFIDEIEKIWAGVQVITKMRKNQKIRYQTKGYTCYEYFESYPGWSQEVKIRGREEKRVVAGGGRLYVPSHNKKRFVIALKYEGESEYRYIMASNLSWDMKEIMDCFTIRWLIEVFFEDWSCYQGFCSLAKQCGVEGSERPLILSLLFDHCFFFHEHQQACIENRSPLATFGSLLEKNRAVAFHHFIDQILKEDSPKEKLKDLMEQLDDVFEIRLSKKHLSNVSIDLEPLRLFG
jgi:DDE superfamily endonuclease